MTFLRVKTSHAVSPVAIALSLAGTLTIAFQSAHAATISKNVIIIIGDGMGWEMARAAAIARQLQAGNSGTNLADFYTAGKGTGLSFQTLSDYALATTYGTTIAPGNRVFNTGNSALDNSNPLIGASPILPGFTSLFHNQRTL